MQQSEAVVIKKTDDNNFYHTVEYQKSCQQIINDLSDLFYISGRVDLREIEMIIVSNLDHNFSRVSVAKLLGVSVRTIRNKLNGSKCLSN